MWKIAVSVIILIGVVLLVRNFFFKRQPPAVKEVIYICNECGEKNCSCDKQGAANDHESLR